MSGEHKEQETENLGFQTSLRLEKSIVDRVDGLAVAIKEKAGFSTKRSSVIRMAIERGVDELEREYTRSHR